METRVLRYFLAVAREENISRAAEVLHITQPTLSRQLSQMEEELGVILFERGTRRIRLTDAGVLLRRRAEEIIGLIDKTEKELAEHNMLVDLGRNDVGKISRPGSVKVDKYMEIQRFSHVMHIGSTVTGTISEEKDALDVVDAILPAGTLSGAPKIRACEIIAELEKEKRGIYGGAVGYLDFAGNVDTCISIRLAYKKNGSVRVQSGAGIVADSIPENEFQECLNKAGAVLQAIKIAEGGLE